MTIEAKLWVHVIPATQRGFTNLRGGGRNKTKQDKTKQKTRIRMQRDYVLQAAPFMFFELVMWAERQRCSIGKGCGVADDP